MYPYGASIANNVLELINLLIVRMRTDAPKAQQMLNARAELDSILSKLTTTVFSDVRSDVKKQIEMVSESQEELANCSTRDEYLGVSPPMYMS